MVDFTKKLKKKDLEKKVNPVEIYETLDRRSETGPLRVTQEKVLTQWFEKRSSDKDLIVKLHTGEGKTLIGLLILQSKLNKGEGPCAFVCANKYLAEQVCLEAEKFGIEFCLIDRITNDIPNDFFQGKKLLITHIQKIFNGKTIFGIDRASVPIGCIILDDSHACIDSIKNSFTITLKNEENSPYSTLKTLFEEDLKEQGEGDFYDIERGAFETFLPIPYWSWIDRKSQVAELLAEHSNDDGIKFAWPILKNGLENCQAFISGKQIEIVPYHVPVQRFGSFWNAKQRILMSATTQDDSFFIKGLGFSIESVINPLTNEEQKWSGEKMILIPSLIHDSLDRDLIVTKLAPPVSKRKSGVVALVSSFKKAEQYKSLGSAVATSDDIFEHIGSLKKGAYDNTLAIVNRYDGIDLPDKACRVLIIDSMPYFDSLLDRYEEKCRSKGDISNIKSAQKIEQGLGRSVRGEKDYSAIILIGPDLVKFVKSVRTSKYFSAQTQKQIQIGLSIVESAGEDAKKEDSAFNTIIGLINQSTNRDEGWKSYYKEEMDSIKDSIKLDKKIYEILKLERDAEEANFKGDNEAAAQKMQAIVDKLDPMDEDRAWYLQALARYTYFFSKAESNKLQKSAFKSNLSLLKPREGITYKKIDYINENRIQNIRNWISQYETYDELSLAVDSVLSDFSFGTVSDKFEAAVCEVGKLLGFKSQRPDQEIKKGPDNLWCGLDNKYFLIECKSEVEDSREEIQKYEAGQMSQHCAWFEEQYGLSPVTRILIIPTRNLSYYGNFTHDVSVMRKGKLKSLKSNIKSFIKEFKDYKIGDIGDKKIQEWLTIHKLEIDNLRTEYVESVIKRHAR